MRTALAVLVLLQLPHLLVGEPLRVMTFNVRYPSKDDGADLWEKRRDLLVDTIRQNRPDVFGTQELFHLQGEYIVSHLSGYKWFGLSRRGNHEDEHMGVFYRADRLKPVDSGNFWLSETPDTPGSSSWDMSLPRMVTWALFERTDGGRFYFYNTHFAHRRQDEEARKRSAALLVERLKSLPDGTPVILTGDFNAPAGGEVYHAFDGVMRDAWETAARRSGPEGTFHGFKGTPRPGRIDWILYRGNIRVLEAETLDHHEGTRYPSDHFPVLAVFEGLDASR